MFEGTGACIVTEHLSDRILPWKESPGEGLIDYHHLPTVACGEVPPGNKLDPHGVEIFRRHPVHAGVHKIRFGHTLPWYSNSYFDSRAAEQAHPGKGGGSNAWELSHFVQNDGSERSAEVLVLRHVFLAQRQSNNVVAVETQVLGTHRRQGPRKQSGLYQQQSTQRDLEHGDATFDTARRARSS